MLPQLFPRLLRYLALGCLCIVACSRVTQADDDGYARPQLLIEAATLAAATPDQSLVILDLRKPDEYNAGHVPGALWVDLDDWAKAFGNGEDAAGWTRRIAALGISATSRVVLYDAARNRDAARVWWILRYWGVPNVQILNGGWEQWQRGKFPIQQETPPAPATSDFVATPQTARLATKQTLLEALSKDALQLVDARSEAEYCGDDALNNKRAGAIPGARHLEWSDLIDAETHRFKPAAEMRRLFAEAGIEIDRPTATYCQSGGRAAVMAFALELMGAEQVQNYYRSWAEWGNTDETPIERGQARGDRKRAP
ncbi:MAG: sulfurtransferase [Pirellulales bacterium]|nr:sulfurtransferase [Pirellulales bacterium]